jgi:hypothetical protein
MKLFDFAFCPGMAKKITALATSCPENWGVFDGHNNHPILHNYIKHTFSKLHDDFESAPEASKPTFLKIVEGSCLIFNTGLYDTRWQRVFAYFVPNEGELHCHKWKLDSFLTEYQLTAIGITELPSKAKYFSNIKELIFDAGYKIVPQYDHIFGDENNNQRIPESIRNSHMKSTLFEAAIELAKKRVDENYKVAVPQYYKNNIQLLLPLYLTSPDKPDLALTLTRDDANRCYLGRTCITMEWAYNNARLIAKPNSDWLTPDA